MTHLEEDESTKPQHSSFHRAGEVPFPPEVDGGEDVSQPNKPAPHTMAPLHVKDEFKLWQSHVMVHSVNTQSQNISLAIYI